MRGHTRTERRATWPIDSGLDLDGLVPLIRREAHNRHLYRPNAHLHKWWARRSGILFRSLLKGFVRDPDRRSYHAPGGLEGLVILDPMMGGGTTLHEALRLGASVIGVVIDPIPVLMARATLSSLPLEEKQRVFETFWASLRKDLVPFFRTLCPMCRTEGEISFTLYARLRSCACGIVGVPESFELRGATSAEPPIVLCPTCGSPGRADRHRCSGPFRLRLVGKRQKRCPECRQPYQDLRHRPWVERFRPLVIMGRCPQGHTFYKPPDSHDLGVLAEAARVAAGLDFGPEETWRIPQGPKSRDLHRHGIASYLELLTPRQRLYLWFARKHLNEVPPKHRIWLGLLLSTSMEFNTLLAGYKGNGARPAGAVRHVFAHHAYVLPYTALENNPIHFGPRSGTLLRLFRDRVVRAGKWARAPIERRVVNGRVVQVVIPGETATGQEVSTWEELRATPRRFRVLHADAGQVRFPRGLVDAVVTDPPYFDSVQYADLSHFFRTWLRFLLPDVADWTYTPGAAAVAETDAQAHRYAGNLARIWRRAVQALRYPHGRVVFTFHHRRPVAWAALTVSLRRAGLRLVAHAVVPAENPMSVHIRGQRSLTHDVVLVLAPRWFPAPFRTWPRPEDIPWTPETAFLAACADLLGHLLDQAEGPETDLWRVWKELFQGRT